MGMREKITAVSFIFFLLSAPSWTQEFDPTGLIGLDLKAVFETFGPPQEVFPFRGAQECQDNVVFFYPDRTYLFWYHDRVWQVRCDKLSKKTIFGLALGMDREEVTRKTGHPLIEQGDSLFFDIEQGKFPFRVRLVFADGTLSDVYVYRSDF
jgi:hypothetical protein